MIQIMSTTLALLYLYRFAGMHRFDKFATCTCTCKHHNANTCRLTCTCDDHYLWVTHISILLPMLSPINFVYRTSINVYVHIFIYLVHILHHSSVHPTNVHNLTHFASLCSMPSCHRQRMKWHHDDLWWKVCNSLFWGLTTPTFFQ